MNAGSAPEPNRGDPKPLAVAVMGPTASGKTELALELASRLPCEIISVDSAMVYRGMDIGTAKPSPKVLAETPHRLVDICEPTESYSAARFRADALLEMARATAAGKVPLLVGGTMLYFRALQRGLSALPAADPRLREKLNQEARTLGWDVMHRRLRRVDPASARRIHPNDPQRIQRALEVYELTGRPMSDLAAERRDGEDCPYRFLKLIRSPEDRAVLHRRIAQRFRVMLDAGFEDEVRGLWARGDLTRDMPAMRSVGYRQMLKYVLGELSPEQMLDRGIVATRQLARRQYTWLRAETEARWLFDGTSPCKRALRLLTDLRL
jgi:tRNA dimethylallyltransferase